MPTAEVAIAFIGMGLFAGGLIGGLIGTALGGAIERPVTDGYKRLSHNYEEEVRKLRNRLDIITNVANYEPEE